jgi:thioredoxin reductase (NADPH)
LIHRRNEFRGALDSVEKSTRIKRLRKIRGITPAEVVGLWGRHIDIVLNENGAEKHSWIISFLFWSYTKLGPIELGLGLRKMQSSEIMHWITKPIYRDFLRSVMNTYR